MNMNGRGSYVSKIDRLIEEHERALQALKLTRDLLNGEAREKKQNDTNGALTDALASEARRRDPYKKKLRYGMIAAQRAKTAALLERFSTRQPRRIAPNSDNRYLGILVARGYLKHVAEGYLRTSKPFETDPRIALGKKPKVRS